MTPSYNALTRAGIKPVPSGADLNDKQRKRYQTGGLYEKKIDHSDVGNHTNRRHGAYRLRQFRSRGEPG